jgi:hypothetical protein
MQWLKRLFELIARCPHAGGMNLIALPIVHTATRRAVRGAHPDDPVIRTGRR